MKIKKILFVFIIIMMAITLTACGNTANENMSVKINRTMDNLSSTLKKIEVIADSDLIVSDIMPTKNIQLNSPSNNKNIANRQIVNYNNNGLNNYYQTIPQNVNTYYHNNSINNINSYDGFGENGFNNNNCYGNYCYNNFEYYSPYNNYNNLPYNNYYNNSRYNHFNNRGISNVNTYGLGIQNVNSYNKAKTVNQNQTNTLSNNNNDTLQVYFNKLSNLYSVASNVVNTNNNINTLKNSINAEISSIKTLSSQIKNKDNLSDSEIRSINSLLENINTYINKINYSRNEVQTELSSVKKLKSNYTSNIENLNSKYVRLINCLESRCSYYNNILSCLFQLENCLNGNCDIFDQYAQYCPNCNQNHIQQYLNNSNNPTNTQDETCKNGNCDVYNNDCENGNCDVVTANDCENGNCTENKQINTVNTRPPFTVVKEKIDNNNQTINKNNKNINTTSKEQTNNVNKENTSEKNSPVQDKTDKQLLNTKINNSSKAIPTKPQKNDYLNIQPEKKDLIDVKVVRDQNKNDPYRIMPTKTDSNLNKTQITEEQSQDGRYKKKIYKINSDDAITTGYIIEYNW